MSAQTVPVPASTPASTINTAAPQLLLSDTEYSYSVPVKYEIAAINVYGENTDPTLIRAVSGLKAGQKITIPGEDLTSAINALWKVGLYSDVKIIMEKTENNLAYLGIILKTRPKLTSMIFENVKKSTAKKIREQVKLSEGMTVTNQSIQNSIYNIREYYVKKGYPHSTIKYREVEDVKKRNHAKIYFDVNPGPRVKIGAIAFEGNKEVTDKKLLKLLKKTKKRKWYNIFRASKFLPDDYEDDKEKIAGYYQTKGFKDAKIVKDSLYDINDKRVGIKIKINEGNRYYFRNIVWSGNTKYTTAQLNGILNIKKGDVYDPVALESRLSINPAGLDVTSLYMDDGYLFFNLNPVETGVDNDSVDIEVRIFEGPQATINKVKVSGNTKTHDHVILRELRTKPGQKFSRADIIRSQRDLTQLGYFNPEKMNVIPTPNAKDGTVDLEYVVEEKPNDQIELSGGYGGGFLVGTLGLSLNNFSARNLFKPKMWQGYPSGDGQRFSIRATSNGKFYQQFNISFTEPWFGGKKPNSFSVTPFYSIQNYGYSMNIAGLTIGLGKRLSWPDDYFVLNHQLSYQYYTYKNYPLFNGQYSSGYSTNLYLKHTLTHSTINFYQGVQVYPNSGSNVVMSLQWTPPYSAFNKEDLKGESASKRFKLMEYHKWKLDLTSFIGFGAKKKLVLMSSANFGLMGFYNRDKGNAPFERFFVGGDGLVGFSIDGRELIRLRGYNNYNAITPTRNYLGGVETGATLYNKFTFELRYPFLTGQAATIYGLAFIEGGTAQNTFKYYNPFELKRSAGGGIRIFLPMFGLLGFDYGYGFDKPVDPNSLNKWNFHIYIGQSLF